MSRERRYFVLAEVLPKSYIADFLGKVVMDKTSPTRHYAPFAGSPRDIAPQLAADIVVWSSRNDLYTHAKAWKIGGGLANLLLQRSFLEEKGANLESDVVECHSMANTPVVFQSLMSNEAYASDVRALLKEAKSSRAYFVTGFLTTQNASFTEFSVKSQRTGLEVTALTLPGGIPKPPSGDDPFGRPNIKPEVEGSHRIKRSMKTADQVIFAVSYDVIKSSRSFDKDAKAFLSRSIVNAGPRRSKPKELAFNGEDSSSECSDEDTGDESTVAIPPPAADEVIFVRSEILEAELFATDDSEEISFAFP